MGDIAPRELISFAYDEGNSVTANVLGRDPGWSAGLETEIVVQTPLVSGRIDLILYSSKLESWADALDKLDAGEDVAWMEMSNGPSVLIQLAGERDCPEVVVEDTSRGPWSRCGCRLFLRTTAPLVVRLVPDPRDRHPGRGGPDR
ncbi:DUF5959 family protein [Streptomyces sp. NPDC002685]|uniref:DUF5959 family protein n=1 Tax=Streptomyces sp. NPDC002685 TaxID=3154540 RepID=UPI0033178CE0